MLRQSLRCKASQTGTWRGRSLNASSLLEHRYTYTYRRQQVWLLSYVESVLNRRGVHNLNEIEHADLAACRKSLQRRFPYLTGANYALEKYLRIKTFLKPAEPKATNPAAILPGRVRSLFKNG